MQDDTGATGPNGMTKQIALATGTVVAEIHMIPNQRLEFHGDGQGRSVLKFGGFVPRRLRLEAEAVSCRVRKRDFSGRLTLRLYQDGQVVALRSTAAAFNGVTVRSDGPWGAARGTRGSTRLFRLRPVRLPRRPVPAFNGPIVPRLEP